MVKLWLWICLLWTYQTYAAIDEIFYAPDQQIVLATKKIELPQYPEAFNPSIFKLEQGFLLTFRYSPRMHDISWASYIGMAILDESFNLVSEPQLLTTRAYNSKTPSQAEDARIFSFRDKLYLIYNDNVDEIYSDHTKRRDMFISELFLSDGQYAVYTLSSPVKLIFEEHYNSILHQKNWVPFEWNHLLYFSYSLHPHEVLSTNLRNGHCFSTYKTDLNIDWIYGKLRGGTPALLIDGEYLAFFHSSVKVKSPASYDTLVWHYFMGAYTFSKEPPFEVTKMTSKPIFGEDFYTPSYEEKKVIFPGGFVDAGPHLYIAYGKDDKEIYIATLDKQRLKQFLVPVKK